MYFDKKWDDEIFRNTIMKMEGTSKEYVDFKKKEDMLGKILIKSFFEESRSSF